MNRFTEAQLVYSYKLGLMDNFQTKAKLWIGISFAGFGGFAVGLLVGYFTFICGGV